jgi:hypothetical protein
MKNLHHFNIVERNDVGLIEKICLEVLDFNINANSRYHYSQHESFLVDDARELINLQNRKHKSGELSVFVVDCGNINTSAQNALLKIFEEPIEGNYFFLTLPQSNVLLPTLLSRSQVINSDFQAQSDYPSYEEILKMNIKKRMSLVNSMIDDLKKEKITKSDLKKFLNQILEQMNQKVLDGDSDIVSKALHINEINSYIDSSGASVKSILEFAIIII